MQEGQQGYECARRNYAHEAKLATRSAHRRKVWDDHLPLVLSDGEVVVFRGEEI